MYSPVVEGQVGISQNGIAKCRGGCVISTSPLMWDTSSAALAFSFEFASISSTATPEVHFGLKHGEMKVDLDYFQLLASIRASSIRPFIPSDGIAVSVHMCVKDQTMIVYINEYPYERTYKLNSAPLSFYLNIKADEAVVFTPFCQDEVPKCFFPNLQPHFWQPVQNALAVRGFHVRGTEDTEYLFSDGELPVLPGLDQLRYFEVEYRSADIGLRYSTLDVSIGFVKHPAATSVQRLGTAPNSMSVSARNRSFNIGGVLKCSLPRNATYGDIIGIGVEASGSAFITFNGEIIPTQSNSTAGFDTFVAVVECDGGCAECVINFGQLPFAWEKARPPAGWCYFTKQSPNDVLLAYGSPGTAHLLNFFPYGSSDRERADTRICKKPLVDGQRYELTAYKAVNRDLMGIGLCGATIPVTNMVGWDSGAVGVHTDDGCLFNECGFGGCAEIPPGDLKDGETLTLVYDHMEICVHRGDSVSSNIDIPGFKPIPAWSMKGSFVIIANFGEMPFASENRTKETDGVKLYNGVKVAVSDVGSSEAGLCVGDFVEARDLSFRGTYVGKHNGYFLFVVRGLDVAIPLDETDPVFVRKVIRVVGRSRELPLTSFGLTSSDLVLYTRSVAEADFASVYATRFGISIMMGKNERGCVMRPLTDLCNNSAFFVLPPDESMTCVFKTKDGTMAPLKSKDSQVLDVIELSSSNLLVLLLGHVDGSDVGWDGQKIVPVTGKFTVAFRFFGFAFRRAQGVVPTLSFVNCGTHIGGHGFPPRYVGVEGLTFVQSGSSGKCFGATGMGLIPGHANYLLTTLNQFLLEGGSLSTSAAPASLPDMSAWSYEPTSDSAVAQPEIPLVTEVNFL